MTRHRLRSTTPIPCTTLFRSQVFPADMYGNPIAGASAVGSELLTGNNTAFNIAVSLNPTAGNYFVVSVTNVATTTQLARSPLVTITAQPTPIAPPAPTPVTLT